jgi:methionyl-tRNA formyltransferase
MTASLKIAYMGTPDFAVPALSSLAAAGYAIPLVVTRPDRRSGRGKKLTPPAVKTRALELGFHVVQPEVLRENVNFMRTLVEASPDLIVVAAYGNILPKAVLDVPPLGCVNVHASLLPKYRGAAPVHRAIEAGERETGVTLMYLSEGMDEGDVIEARSFAIDDMNAGRVTDLLAEEGAALLLEVLPSIVAGTARRAPQDATRATYAPLVGKGEGHLDFGAPVETILRKVRAMTPSPGAYAFLGGEKIKALRAVGDDASAYDGFAEADAGAVLKASEGVVAVKASNGVVLLKEIQPPGGRPMDADAYLRGHALNVSSRFE